MAMSSRPLAVITGASSGIGFHLAQNCIEHGFDIFIAADHGVEEAAATLASKGGSVETLEVDLGTEDGVDELVEMIGDRPVAVLLANAGHGLGRGFLEQDWDDARDVIDTNVTGTAYLVHQLAPGMVARREGRILFTGSIAGSMPGTFQAVYNGTKAFIDSFSWALRNELQDTGVTVTCLMPGLADAAEVAKVGFEAMMAGEGDVAAGFKSKVEVALAHVTPASMVAEQHRRMAEPGTGA